MPDSPGAGAPGADLLDAETTYRALHAAQRQAADAFPHLVRESSYRIAGQPVTIRLVGSTLGDRLPRALSHLRTNEAPQAGLLIEAWDEAETGISSPCCKPHDDYAVPGSTTVSEDGRYVVFSHAQIKSALDRVRRHIVSWVAATDRLTQYELGRPWQSELLLWQRDRELQPVHAGFIERDGHGILLGGPGGSGKSTTALVCMGEGWSYLADDYVGLERQAGGVFMGYGLYCSSHLEPAHLQRFGSLAPGAIPGKLAREDKSLVLLSEREGHRLGGQARIAALALPRVVDAEATTVRRAGKAEALLRLAPSSLLLLPYAGLGNQSFHSMVALVEQIPTYWLELGRDFKGIPAAVSSLLEQALRR